MNAQAVKERPILFSPMLAGKVHDGLKTQTRRVVKADVHDMPESWWIDDDLRRFGTRRQYEEDKWSGVKVRCPYGVPGDRLFVRESCRIYDWTEDGEPFIQYRADDSVKLCRVPEAETDRWADHWSTLSVPENFKIDGRAAERRWRPSIHMPRWACRTFLTLTDVRVERVESITEADAVAEGITPDFPEDECNSSRPFREGFLRVFYDLNKRAPRGTNPWVWVLIFHTTQGETA